MGNIAYIRAELERLRQRAALAAEEIHKGTNDMADLEIFVEKKKNSQARIKTMIEEALPEIEELGLAEDATQEEAKHAEQVKKKEQEEKEQEKIKEDGAGGGQSA